MKLKWKLGIMVLMLCMLGLISCAHREFVQELPDKDGFVGKVEMEAVIIEDEAVALVQSPIALPDILEPSATGVKVKRSGKAVVDYSNTDDGYVMVQYTANTANRLKVQVKGPATTYTYDLVPGPWATFPLSDGSGNYQVAVYENVTDNKYAVVLMEAMIVTLKDEFAPFLRPNQYVNYTADSAVVAKARELTEKLTHPLEKVEAVYNFAVKEIVYDREKAATVKSGYLPVLDTVLTEKKGICFDYAALMTAMLRSQGVPCKLVVGYAGTAYHAWISVWTEESGWVDGAIFFDGAVWKRMDPTFASSGAGSAAIMQYIGDGTNYTQKYLY